MQHTVSGSLHGIMWFQILGFHRQLLLGIELQRPWHISSLTRDSHGMHFGSLQLYYQKVIC